MEGASATASESFSTAADPTAASDGCPISLTNLVPYLMNLNSKLELPWRPYYTQSGNDGAGEDDESTMTTTLGMYAVAATIAFTVFVYSFENLLDGRQLDSYKRTTFPKELEETVGLIDAEREREEEEAANKAKKQAKEEETKEESKKKEEEKEKDTKEEAKSTNSNSNDSKIDTHKPLLPQLHSKFTKSQSYGLDKIHFSMISSAYDTTETILFLLLGFLPYIWDTSTYIGTTYFNWNEIDNEIYISLIFLAIMTIQGTITSLPFELYSTFRIEKKHGFNKQTLGLFFTDKAKSLVLTFVIGGPFVALLLKIIKSGGDNFFLYVWAFMFCFSVFMMTIVPIYIMPLFNKYEPLKEGTLKAQIYELAGKLNYPLKKLFVMDGSKRSSHSNAFMFGFGSNKRIVLFDTLLTQVHDTEILAILGHELGHWKLGHTLTNFCVTQVYFGASFYAFSLCYNSTDLYQAFGFDKPNIPVPTIIALMLFFQTIWAPIDKVLSFILTVFSRKCEFQADEFSVNLGMSQMLQSGLCKIHLENLGAMCPDRWYSTYHYSHPPLVERLSAMMVLDKKKT